MCYYPAAGQSTLYFGEKNMHSPRQPNVHSIIIAVAVVAMASGLMLAATMYFSKGVQAKTPNADRVLNVDTGIWYPSVQAAIDAPLTINGHTLSLTQGIYMENIVISKSLALTSSDPLSTVLDGNSQGRVVSITPGVNVSIANVTIQNGQVIDGSNGGGIANQGVLTLTNSRVVNNWVSFFDNILGGGGIYNTGTMNIVSSTVGHNVAAGIDDVGLGIANLGVLTITDSDLSQNYNNVSPPPGSALYNVGEVSLHNVTISQTTGAGIHNHAGGVLSLSSSVVSRNSGNLTGGIYNNGLMTITLSRVTDNSTGIGGITAYQEAGGIFNNNILTVVSSTVSQNKSCEAGSGVYNAGSLRLDGSTISDNSHFCIPAVGGAGITNDGTLSVTNSTLSRNTSGFGSGLLAHAGTVELNSATIADNVAQQSGGGIAFVTGTLTIQNTIIARNVGGVAPDCAGSFTSLGHNLIGKSNGCAFVPVSGDIAGTITQPVNALLGPLGNFGGYNLTIGLTPGSPAIDTGNPATCPNLDQRGFARQGTCDIGAYEFGVGPGVKLGYIPLVHR
jgi:hypothetical protein